MSPRADRGAKPITSSVFYILLALADEERHGLGIAADIAMRTEGAVDLGPGTLYNAIRKMTGQGLIEDSTGRGDEGDDPRRRYYRITRAGRQVLREEARRLEVVVRAARAKKVLGR